MTQNLRSRPIRPISALESRRKARSAAQRRWRQNERAGKRLAGVPVDAAILCWLERHYPGACDFDNLADVGRLIGRILEASARE
jgi:hypothetical protein